ncbi:hypothetical protein JQX13_27860 [Archangium violaceum]|uniref:B-box zinc finger protein n=1 Tax=Archangium violaceum TaxID=83451 RepID=UPI00193BBA15|nr:B-box zinc finger protein [Archangium violaceum]QRK04092.1 hypothetical protein JQX13_27860 [Archangium violaceum]
MTQGLQSMDAGAFCARHGGQPASATCVRCGNFMCGECGAGGREDRCPTCRERVADPAPFPLSRTDWRFGALWTLCWDVFRREWLLLSLGMLLLAAVGPVFSLGVSLVSGALGGAAGEEGMAVAVVLVLLATPFILVIQGVMQLGVHRVSWAVLRGGTATFPDFLGQWRKTLSYVVLGMLGSLVALATVLYAGFMNMLIPMFMGLAVSLERAGLSWLGMLLGGGLSLVVILLSGYALFRMSFLLSVAMMELACNDTAGPLVAFRIARVITRGQLRWFLLVCLISAPLLLLGVLMLGIGVFPALALVHLLLVGLYLTLRNGVDLGAREKSADALGENASGSEA